MRGSAARDAAATRGDAPTLGGALLARMYACMYVLARLCSNETIVDCLDRVAHATSGFVQADLN